MTSVPTITHMNGGRYRVYCLDHHLDRTVATEAHATNLWALHLRRDHADTLTPGSPDTVDLTAAAAAVVRSDRGAERGGALMVWQALTGMSGDDALAYAHAVAATPIRTTAVIPPF